MCANWLTKAAADGKALIIGFISQDKQGYMQNYKNHRVSSILLI